MIKAQQDARRLGHGYIGTEHLLLGLPGDPDAPAGTTLAELEITAEA